VPISAGPSTACSSSVASRSPGTGGDSFAPCMPSVARLTVGWTALAQVTGVQTAEPAWPLLNLMSSVRFAPRLPTRSIASGVPPRGRQAEARGVAREVAGGACLVGVLTMFAPVTCLRTRTGDGS
jgi:hypothetical protein